LMRPLNRISDRIQHLHLSSSKMLMMDTAAVSVEIWHLAQVTENMASQVSALRLLVQEASQKILDTAKFMFSASQHQLTVLTAQQLPAQETATAVRELVLSAQHISEDVKAVVEVANKTLQFARQGQNSVLKVVNSMEDIRRSSQLSSEKIILLGKQSESVNDVVKTIDQIIADTKLLAFNATIEAARAQDEGKEFGSVALEVKRLAEEVLESTEDIQELIQEIQREVYALVLAIEEEMKTVQRGMQLAEEAGAALQQIFGLVRLTTESAVRIAAATHQQKTVSEHVLHAVEDASLTSEQFSQESKMFAVTAAELNILAEGLRQIIAKFETP